MTDLSGVLQSVAKANGLPNSHYLDPDTHAAERENLFFNQWSALTFAKNLPTSSYVLPIEFLDLPLLVVRDKTGDIRVFQNTCRHRGMILVEEPGPLKGAIRCPYHSWCYSPEGNLVTTPHVGGPGKNIDPDIDRDELGLIEIRSHIWNDVIFINVSGNAPEFVVQNSELLERWNEFDQPKFHGGEDSSFELTVNCNWKLAVENYCESYHLPWIHPGLNAYSRLEDHYHIVNEGKYSGQGTTVYDPKLSGNGNDFENFNNLSQKWDKSAEYVALYPNVLLGIHRDHFYAIILQPLDQKTTVEQVEIYYAKESSTQPEFQGLRSKNTSQWKGIFEEDVFVVEGMQRGREGVLFDGGKFSPVMDEPTHTFHHWVATQMSK